MIVQCNDRLSIEGRGKKSQTNMIKYLESWCTTWGEEDNSQRAEGGSGRQVLCKSAFKAASESEAKRAAQCFFFNWADLRVVQDDKTADKYTNNERRTRAWPHKGGRANKTVVKLIREGGSTSAHTHKPEAMTYVCRIKWSLFWGRWCEPVSNIFQFSKQPVERNSAFTVEYNKQPKQIRAWSTALNTGIGLFSSTQITHWAKMSQNPQINGIN